MATLTNFLRRRRTIAAVMISMVVGVLSPLGTASAATVTYRCAFGPLYTNDHRSWLTFHTEPGGGNDYMNFQGVGSCSDGVPLPQYECRLAFRACPILRSYVATMIGGDGDVGSSSSVHAGRCDADVSPYGTGTQNRLMIPHAGILVRILINGQEKSFEWSFRTIDTANNPDFPGPGATRGVIYDANLNQVGSIAITSRIGGECPPAGKPDAFYALTFSVAQ